MKIQPILTEKSLEAVKNGYYTFWVDKRLTKDQIKLLVQDLFNVHVKKIRTMNVAGEIKRTVFGRKRKIQPRKKAIVKLAEKEKIDLFDEKK